MPRFAVAPLLAFSCLWAGCFDNSSSVVGVPTRSLLTVDPDVFLGSVRCSPTELRKYVVTLKTVSIATDPEHSSLPTDCTNRVSFAAPPLLRDVDYAAFIDGYDRDDIVPEIDNQATGDRNVKDPATNERVLPRWTTECGEPNDAGPVPDGSPALSRTRLFGATEVFLHGCLPLRLAASPGSVGEAGATPDGQADASDDGAAAPDGDPDGGSLPGDDGSAGNGG
jgi:hypothetical protein